MQLPEPPPPPLAPLWDRVLRARALPPDLDVQLLYVAIRDRLIHPEWEVRLHALRVLADLLPLSGNALSFPFDQVVDNLGHSSPNVRKAALDALKVFCNHCENPDCATRAIIDKCSYRNIRPHSANIDTKVNVITGLILSLPSLLTILRRRNPALDMFPIFSILGEKLYDPFHKDVAQRSLIKLRRVCGARDYMMLLSRLDTKVQNKFRKLCETFDEDSLDVYYAPRQISLRDGNNQQLVQINQVFNAPVSTPLRISSDSSSDDSYRYLPFYTNNNFAKVIIETEIKFDSDTAITMTVLEENETESEKNLCSEEDYDSSDRNMLRYGSDDDDSDTDVVMKKVRFGGESVKIRTPDSDALLTSEDDINQIKLKAIDNIQEVTTENTVALMSKANEIKCEAYERESFGKQQKRSGIPLPVIHNKSKKTIEINSYGKVKLKSKSLSELYDFFRTKNEVPKDGSSFALTLSEVRYPEKVPSPVETHKEIEVLHNLQRSPTVSPRRQTRIHLEQNGYVLNLLASSPLKEEELSPRPPSPLRGHYEWEDLGLVPDHVIDQLHNKENWISAVKAADLLHSMLLDAENVRKMGPAALSLVQHMWALSDAVSAARAPAEGAVCTLVRSAANENLRSMLPALVSRMSREPLPAALPHALLQRLALHHIVDLIFDPEMIGVSGDCNSVQSAQLRTALCLARAAGPAAVLAAVRRRLAGTARADMFCDQLRERLRRPVENIKPVHLPRSSQLPVPVRRRARSTPPPPGPPPRRLRPLPDSAPLPGISQPGRDVLLKPLTPIALSDKDSSTYTTKEAEVKPIAEDIFGEQTIVDIPADEVDAAPPTPAPRSPSIHVEDYSEKSIHASTCSIASQKDTSLKSNTSSLNDLTGLQKSLYEERIDAPPAPRIPSRHSTRSVVSKSRSASPSPIKSPDKSRNVTPDPCSDVYAQECQRDVRSALAECIVPAKHEDWELIVNGLVETERLAADPAARAPAASWKASARAAAAHVRSLRSRVARAACSTLGTIFEHRGRVLESEIEECTMALLDRCADVNRFLRADAATALGQVACGSSSVRAGVALAKRGCAHRAGPVRAAAAQALAKLVEHNGASRIMGMHSEPRTVVLRAAGELLGDASPDTRVHARHLCLALSDDNRFEHLLKDAMTPTRYKSIQKFVEKLRCR